MVGKTDRVRKTPQSLFKYAVNYYTNYIQKLNRFTIRLLLDRHLTLLNVISLLFVIDLMSDVNSQLTAII